ncbi:voltage-dependent anion channel domain-containing protein [Hirsutella rhossiliensis]|uniref:Voltage-dependent anion channel domain-containing protein n=1 Tax=Hirsutella rhossiliensis TaxID=111463 RepID=A0A9P8MUS6_9HYPO|nr:voltage-dependent anion channel domain-containing protein [Hirsutella rhossiliensis]KAH0961432.1 voltage-dependent anion channel domain-containing protein [Hirsutella rhossiliensis]
MDRNGPRRFQAWTDSNQSTRRNSTATQRSREYPPLDMPPDEKHPKGLGYNTTSTPVLESQRPAPPAPEVDIFDPNRPKLPFRQRLHHFTWAWYTLPMSAGGLSLLVFAQPNQFPGLKSIGLVVYIINIIVFSTITILMLTRFFLHPGDMTSSLRHPREGFFFPTFFLSVATIITSTERYAIPKNDTALVWAIQGAFWAYLTLTLILAIGQYSFVFAAHSFGLQTMMPTWILPIFPIMLSGTIASVIADTQPDIAAIPILIAGLTCQGLGFSVAVLMYAHMVGRLMQSGLPNREHRPGLFMCVGPPAFTALAVIGMANGLPKPAAAVAGSLFLDVGVIKTIAVIVAVFLWALSFWWFGIALVAVIQSPPRYFHLGWWAMVFPNTGFTLATISIAKEIGTPALLWVTTGMSIVMLLIFSFVLYHHIRAVIVQDIMYPGRDEDVEDH